MYKENYNWIFLSRILLEDVLERVEGRKDYSRRFFDVSNRNLKIGEENFWGKKQESMIFCEDRGRNKR